MARPYRVLIVDDSALVRHLLRKIIGSSPEFEVAGVASNGVECLSLLVSTRPDVITLDMWMPRMDGLETLRHIMSEHPIPVLMLSALTVAGAQVSLEALSLGAVDYLTKPSSIPTTDDHPFTIELLAKLTIAAQVRPSRLSRFAPDVPGPRTGESTNGALGDGGDDPAARCRAAFGGTRLHMNSEDGEQTSSRGSTAPSPPTARTVELADRRRPPDQAHAVTPSPLGTATAAPVAVEPPQGPPTVDHHGSRIIDSSSSWALRSHTRRPRHCDSLVVIGSSTGGPQALDLLFSDLDVIALEVALLVVQHMPAVFTQSLATRLGRRSRAEVREACEGDLVAPGLALVAPGGWHMTLGGDKRLHLDQSAPIHSVRPAIDRTLLSLAEHWTGRCLTVVLTGMGTDGTAGARALYSRGSEVYAQDEATCIVYGMPRSVIEAGVATEVLPLDRIAAAISKWARAGHAAALNAV